MKATIPVLLFFLLALPCFPQAPGYDGADASTKAVLASVDKLIADRKYETAYKMISGEDKNPYLVAKRVEMATNYFVQSINHKIFAFKDLQAGETLEALRRGKGTFSTFPFDPEVIVGNLLAAGSKNPLLYKALGDYFYDVSLRYSGRWTEDDSAIALKAAENYQKALSAGLFTTTMLTNYGDKATELGDYKTGADLYAKALTLDPALLNAHFNLAYCHLMLGNYDTAMQEGEKAILNYADDANYRLDALLLCSDAAYYSKNFNRALDYLGKALLISRDDYRVYQKLGNVYLGMGNTARAAESLDSLFALAPTNPGATQVVSKVYLGANQKDALLDFYQRNLKKYAAQPEAQGNLFFHLGLQYEADGNKEDALNAAKKAKEAFVKAGRYSDDVQAAVEGLIERNS